MSFWKHDLSRHPCNAAQMSEGIDEEGPLYVRREWAGSKFGLVEMQVPDDFTPQGWGQRMYLKAAIR